jgi:hypothetical protein
MDTIGCLQTREWFFGFGRKLVLNECCEDWEIRASLDKADFQFLNCSVVDLDLHA